MNLHVDIVNAHIARVHHNDGFDTVGRRLYVDFESHGNVASSDREICIAAALGNVGPDCKNKKRDLVREEDEIGSNGEFVCVCVCE